MSDWDPKGERVVNQKGLVGREQESFGHFFGKREGFFLGPQKCISKQRVGQGRAARVNSCNDKRKSKAPGTLDPRGLR